MTTAQQKSPLCECGHPQDRHIFGATFCTFSVKRKTGVGHDTCNCTAFKLGNPLYKQVMEGINPDG